MRRLIEIMATERCEGDVHLYDELVQEGLIAEWLTRQAKPDATDTYVTGAVRYRMRDVVRGRPLTGEVGRRGWSDAHDSVVGPLVNDEGEPVFDEQVDYSTGDTIEALEVDTEVRQAVAALPDDRDREAVFLRFWGGMTYPEVAEVTGHKRRLLESRWATHARPQLVERLGHLAAA